MLTLSKIFSQNLNLVRSLYCMFKWHSQIKEKEKKFIKMRFSNKRKKLKKRRKKLLSISYLFIYLRELYIMNSLRSNNVTAPNSFLIELAQTRIYLFVYLFIYEK